MFLILSASLNPESRSRILGRACHDRLAELEREAVWFDLVEHPLPLCDGATAYGHANVQKLAKLIESADAIFIASPIYNFDVNAVAKNAIELTGRAWTGKVVSMMMAAGGQGSYMSGMSLANSLMLDFRCIIVPRFVYATGDVFDDGNIIDQVVTERIELLVQDTLKIADALTSK